MDPFNILVLAIAVAVVVGGLLIFSGWIWAGVIIMALPIALFVCLAQMRI